MARIIHNGISKEVKVLPRESEEELRFKEFLWILSQADRRYLEELAGNRIERRATLDSQIEDCDKKVIKRKIARSNKNYNLTQTAHLLKVHRQTIYYWISKRWINPKRNCRNYPIFTVLDIENIINWRNSLKRASF